MRASAACRKGSAAFGPGHGQPVPDVGLGFVRFSGPQVVSRDDRCASCSSSGPRQHAAQFGLADQHDLQQLALGRFQVRQQAQLFQHVGTQRLCFVDHEHSLAALGMQAEQEAVQGVDMGLEAAAVGWGAGCRTRGTPSAAARSR
jgi:hypothetical protein